MVLDYDGRILAQADPGPGEKIVVAPIDITALRHERSVRQGHHMLSHLRTEAYPVYNKTYFPPEQAEPQENRTVEIAADAISAAKERMS